jgi:transglutaminase-like putative cysteine protease
MSKKLIFLIIALALTCATVGCIMAPARTHVAPEVFKENTFYVTLDGLSYAVGTNTSSWVEEESVWARDTQDYNKTPDDVYFKHMVYETKSEPVYEDILYDLRYYRNLKNLDNDTYMELIIAFVRSIPYDNESEITPRTPIEVVYDGKGDCDEKSVLAAGLLATEGYATSLIHIYGTGSADHMGVGVRGEHNAFNYEDTGYLFVETTTTYPMGASDYKTMGGYPAFTPISSFYETGGDIEKETATEAPSVYPIRETGLTYTQDEKALAVYTAYENSYKQIYCWKAKMKSLKAMADACETMYYTASEYSAGRYASKYNAAIDEYNNLIDEYNSGVETFNYLLDNTDSISTQYITAREWLDKYGYQKTSCGTPRYELAMCI